jgi:hypothetical protein
MFVYAVMKSGIKSVDGSNNIGEIMSHKAQKHMVCMFMFFSISSKIVRNLKFIRTHIFVCTFTFFSCGFKKLELI